MLVIAGAAGLASHSVNCTLSVVSSSKSHPKTALPAAFTATCTSSPSSPIAPRSLGTLHAPVAPL